MTTHQDALRRAREAFLKVARTAVSKEHARLLCDEAVAQIDAALTADPAAVDTRVVDEIIDLLFVCCAKWSACVDMHDVAEAKDAQRLVIAAIRALASPQPAAHQAEQVEAGEAPETEQSIAADAYWNIAELIGTLPGYSVYEHVQTMHELLQKCSDYLHDIPESDVGGDDEGVALAADVRHCLAGQIDRVRIEPTQTTEVEDDQP